MAVVMNSFDREKALSLCPLVFEAAEEGDATARRIIVEQAETLAEYATAGIRRFGMQDLAFDVVLSGSLFKGRGPLLIDAVQRAVADVAPRAKVARPQYEPAVGGVLLAYDALEIRVSDEMYEQLARTTPDAELFNTADSGAARPGEGAQT
jgi:N-acetylglucosamine kinase-like BadF-type ATPase